jgi:glycosyltransferase domain-containing protein
MASPRSRYTLLIPTFNRPAELRGLIGYLAARRFPYPVRVLDSSSADASAQNRGIVSGAGIDAIHQPYDAVLGLHEKVALALADVDATYCSLCADDDVLLTDTVEELLGALDADPSLAVAHGYYVNFRFGRDFELWNTDYSSPSNVTGDAMHRIVRQMRAYQAIFYGIHRTSSMRAMRVPLNRVKSLWAKELLTSSLTLIGGGAYRAPTYYMARRTAPSITATGWHPDHFFAAEPARLFLEYLDYRTATLEWLTADAACGAAYPKEQVERVFDLAHLKYLGVMLAPDVLDYLIRETLRGERTPQEMIEGMWHGAPARPKSGGIADRFRQAQRLLHPATAAADSYYLWRLVSLISGLRFREKLDASLGPAGDRLTVARATRDGRKRHYGMTRALLTQELADGGRVTASHLANMIRQLDDYV